MVDVFNLQSGTKYIMPAAKSMDDWTNAKGNVIHDEIQNVNDRTDAVAALANRTRMLARAGETFTVVKVTMPGGPGNPFRSYEITYDNDMADEGDAPYKITTGMFAPEAMFQLAPAGGRRKRRTRKMRKTRKTRKGGRRAH